MFRRDENKEDCFGSENERKTGQQGSRLCVVPWTLPGFGPHVLGREKSKAKVLCLQQEADM